jgi:hypothetical protein
VVNVPRPLYYRRHRADSLTTAAGTGHGSPARRQVLNALADRARTNVAVAAAGAAPDLDPFATSGLVDLRHVCGPTLDALPARAARTAPPAPAAPRPAAPPVFVLGGAASGADALVLSLGQHPQVAPVPTSDWLVPFVQAAQTITATSVDGHVAPGATGTSGPSTCSAGESATSSTRSPAPPTGSCSAGSRPGPPAGRT